MKKILDLVAPELALVFDLLLIGEILYHQDGLIGDLRLFNAELEELFFRGMRPVEADEFLRLALHDLRPVDRAIPGETEYIVPLVYFICEPLLQTCRST